jgi:Family of unknown function (DUF5519)
MVNILESIKNEILSWPRVPIEPHRLGSLEFKYDKMGYMHGNTVVDFPLSTSASKRTFSSGKVLV